jgi:hypothetical protein
MTRKNSTSKKGNTEDGWKCELCSIKFTEDKAEVLECEYCEKHFCRACVKLNSAEYKLLSKRSDLHWYCPPYEEKELKNLKIEKEIEERCKDYLNLVEARLGNLERKIDKKADIDQVKAMIEESKLDTASYGEGTKEVNELEEYKESVARRNNIIILKSKESDEIEPDQRKTDDIMIVNELCKITGANHESIKNVTRLGE